MHNPNWERNENKRVISQALENVVKEIGAKHITSGTSTIRIALPHLRSG